MDVGAERSYEALRSRLCDLHYYQPLSVESTQLVERILGDLVKSVESFQTLKHRHTTMAQAEKEMQAEIQALRAEIPRLQAENQSLHKIVIQCREEVESANASKQLETKKLRDLIEDQKVLLAAESQRWRSVMRDNDILKQKLKELLHINNLERQGGLPQAAISGDAFADFQAAAAAEAENAKAQEEDPAVYLADQLSRVHQQCAKLEQEKLQVERALHLAEQKSAAVGAGDGDADVAKLQRLNRQLESQVDFLNAQYESVKAQCVELVAVGDAQSAREGELVQATATLEQKVSTLETTLAEQQRSAAAALAGQQTAGYESLKEREERKVQVAQLQQMKERLEEELRKARAEHADGDKWRRQEVEHLQEVLKEELRTKAAAVGDLDGKVQALSFEVEQLRASLATCEARKTEVESRLEMVDSGKVIAFEEAREHRQAMEQARLDVHVRTKQMAELQAQVEQYEERLKNLSGEKGTLTQHLVEQNESAMHKEKELRELAVAQQGLTSKLAASDVASRGLQDDLHQSRAQRAHLERELKLLRATEIPQLRAQTEKLEKDLATAEEVAKVVQEQHRELSRDYDKAMEDLYAVQREQGDVRRAHQEREQRLTQKMRDLEAAVKEKEDELRAARRAENEVQRRTALEARRGDRAEGEKEDLVEQVRQFEHQMAAIQERVAALSGEKEELDRRCADEEEKYRCEQATSAALQQQLTQRANEAEEQRGQLVQLQEEVERITLQCKAQEKECARLDDVRSTLQKTEVRENAMVGELQKRIRTLEVDKAHGEAEIRLHKEQEGMWQKEHQRATTELNDTKNHVVQLTTLLNALETTREQLVVQLKDSQQSVDRERDLRGELIAMTQERETDVGSLHQQIAALQAALAAMDLEKDELQSDADGRAEDLAVTKEEMHVARENIERLQRSVEDARRSHDLQAKEMVVQEEEIARLRNQEEYLSFQAAQAHGERDKISRERHGFEDDLRHMTHENQLLNEEIQNLRAHVETLRGHSDEKAVEVDRQQTKLQTTVLERDDVLEMYKESVEATQRQQAQLVKLLNEKDDLLQSLHEMQLHLREASKTAEDAREEQRQSQLKVIALQQQASDLTKRCEERTRDVDTTQKQQAAQARELQIAQMTQRELDARKLQVERDFAHLQQQFDNERIKAEKTATACEEAEAFAREEQSRARQLEELLAKEREAKKDSSGDVVGMYRTLEQQYALIGEMDQDLIRLRAENEDLKQRVKR